jgi:predicted dehydrogenase
VYTCVLGNFKSVQSVFKVQDKTAKTLDDKYSLVDPAYPVSAPDTMFIQGVLENGGVASLSLRSVRAAVDDTGFRWIISGTKGEIELTTKPGLIGFLPPGGSQIRVRKWGSAPNVVDFETDESDHIRKISPPGPNVARVWEVFAKGEKDGYASIEESLKTQELLELIHRDAIWAP